MSLEDTVRKVHEKNGIVPAAGREASPGTGTHGSPTAGEAARQPSAPVEAAPPPPPSEAEGCFAALREDILGSAGVTEDIASLLALWALSTWFSDCLPIHPCLVISGPPEVGAMVLTAVARNCRDASQLAGFQRRALFGAGDGTLLVAERHMSQKQASLLGSLTTPGFGQYSPKGVTGGMHPTAVWVGEVPLPRPIPHSLSAHIPNFATGFRPAPRERPGRLPDHIARVLRYRDAYADEVRAQNLWAAELRLDQREVASVLLNCLVGSPDLQQKLLALLRAEEQEQSRSRSANFDARIIEATAWVARRQLESRGMCYYPDRPRDLYVQDIRDHCFYMTEQEGLGFKLTAAKVGRTLNRVGLITQRLSSRGNGLVLNRSTLMQIQQLAKVYGVEVSTLESWELSGMQGSRNQITVEDVEGVEVYEDALPESVTSLASMQGMEDVIPRIGNLPGAQDSRNQSPVEGVEGVEVSLHEDAGPACSPASVISPASMEEVEDVIPRTGELPSAQGSQNQSPVEGVEVVEVSLHVDAGAVGSAESVTSLACLNGSEDALPRTGELPGAWVPQQHADAGAVPEAEVLSIAGMGSGRMLSDGRGSVLPHAAPYTELASVAGDASRQSERAAQSAARIRLSDL